VELGVKELVELRIGVREKAQADETVRLLDGVRGVFFTGDYATHVPDVDEAMLKAALLDLAGFPAPAGSLRKWH
jgi:hypothetical protein